MLLIGIATVIARKFSSAISGQSQMMLVRAIKRDHAKASAYASKLDLLMEKRMNITREVYELIRAKINSASQIGDYLIHYSTRITEDQFLFFTEIFFTDFDVTVTGDSGDVRKSAQHNFLLQYNSMESQLELYSDMYTDLNGKLQKQGFIEALMKTQLKEY